ncbi:MAG: M48 family metalloprotease [Polyangiales bacterium]
MAVLACGALASCTDLIDRIRDQVDPPPAEQPQPTTVNTTPPPAQPTQPAMPNNPTGIQIPGLGNLPIQIPGVQIPGNTNNGGGTTTPARNGPPAYNTLAAAPPGSYDASGALTPAFQRSEVTSVFNELVAALPESERRRIVGIPLSVREQGNEPNAAAGCTRGRSYMMITSALLTIIAASSEAKAWDELTNERRVEGYYTAVANVIRQHQPVIGITPGWLSGPMALDPRKLARQRHLFDEQVAFVLGHELAHHYRGHTPCASGGPASPSDVTAEELTRVASTVVPPFNQPMETEADQWGITNTLDAGRNRQGGDWNEEGAMLSLDFFAHLSRFNPATAFLRTHPHPNLRKPIIQAMAGNWRNGGRPTQVIPGMPGTTVPIPIPIQIPGLGQR